MEGHNSGPRVSFETGQSSESSMAIIDDPQKLSSIEKKLQGRKNTKTKNQNLAYERPPKVRRIISYTHNTDKFCYNYKLNDNVIERVTLVKDLGVYFVEGLTFDFYINKMLELANRKWQCIIRNCDDFKNPLVLKTLYISMVRSVGSYGSVIWRPSYNNVIERFGKIQHKVLRKIAFLDGSPMDTFSHDYSVVAKKWNIRTNESFCNYLKLSFMYKLFKENQNSPFIELFTPI